MSAFDDPKMDLQQELARNRNIEADLLTEVLSSRRAAWRVATSAVVLLVLFGLVLCSLLLSMEPSRPYVVRVDNATGNVEHVTALVDGHESYSERIERYFLHQYVLACESYDWNTIQSTYNRCGLFSDATVQRAFHAKFEDNPKQGHVALDKKYGNHTRVVVEIRSITPGENQTATVRFTRTIVGPSNPPPPEQVIATISYRFVNTAMTEEVARINPLGFQVNTYVPSIETLR